jgi:NAD(P)H-flavin reductase
MLLENEAPRKAQKAKPVQFITLWLDRDGERIPITIHEVNHIIGFRRAW